MKYFETRYKDKEIDNPNLFQAEKCYLNFNEDRVEYQVKIHYVLAKHVKVINKCVFFITTGKRTVFLPIINDEAKREDNFVIIKFHANFKDRLLDLFSFSNKKFRLALKYLNGEESYMVIFDTPIPIIGQLEDWNPKVKFTRVCMPTDFAFGKDLKRLFENNFRLSNGSFPSESKLQRDL